MKSILVQLSALLLVSLAFGVIRQVVPNGIRWTGRWPTEHTSAREAYTLMAKEGDPGFIGLEEAARFQAKRTAVFLDARKKSDFEEARIQGARSLPYYEVDRYQEQALTGLSADSLIVIYCEGVGCELSFFLGRELQAAGYTEVRIFYGGFPEWNQAGLPMERGP